MKLKFPFNLTSPVDFIISLSKVRLKILTPLFEKSVRAVKIVKLGNISFLKIWLSYSAVISCSIHLRCWSCTYFDAGTQKFNSESHWQSFYNYNFGLEADHVLWCGFRCVLPTSLSILFFCESRVLYHKALLCRI